MLSNCRYEISHAGVQYILSSYTLSVFRGGPGREPFCERSFAFARTRDNNLQRTENRFKSERVLLLGTHEAKGIPRSSINTAFLFGLSLSLSLSRGSFVPLLCSQHQKSLSLTLSAALVRGLKRMARVGAN